MKIWMIRHGESETNKQGLWTGWLDAPLTEKGREEALRVQSSLSGVSFDKIYSSDLVRAKRTADIAISGCEYELSPLLREINVGDLAGQPIGRATDGSVQPSYVDGYAQFGGETTAQFRERIESFMKTLECKTCENIAVFSHWGVIKTYLEIVLGIEIPKNKICGNNCLIAVFEYLNSQWRLHSWINL